MLDCAECGGPLPFKEPRENEVAVIGVDPFTDNCVRVRVAPVCSTGCKRALHRRKAFWEYTTWRTGRAG